MKASREGLFEGIGDRWDFGNGICREDECRQESDDRKDERERSVWRGFLRQQGAGVRCHHCSIGQLTIDMLA